MDKLKEARSQIDAIDKEIASLFEKRMGAAAEIAEYKKEFGLPVFDPKREEELLAKEIANIENQDLRAYYANFLSGLFDVSKSYQAALMNGAKYAYCGIKGAYAYLAAKKIAPTSNYLSFPTFEKAYAAVVDGKCDGAVLPLENSSAGDVGSVMDLAFSGNLYITQMVNLEISHALMAKKGVKLSQIKRVWSHPQALAQCDEYINLHKFETLEYPNTAVACKSLADSDFTDVAVIASKENAEIYGLEILELGINSEKNNTTRFGLFSRAMRLPDPRKKDEYSIIVFTVKNEAGSLAKALNIIGSHGFNMKNLRSRPLRGLIWNYYFYIELEGNVNNADGKEMIRELSTFCDKLKLLGSYTEE
ncbi:MAG: chorismate mutase [Bacilli bacterium]|nr:chorismate mutase [Bacilli bacterium]